MSTVTSTVAIPSSALVTRARHFVSIAWLYREDYETGRIRMLPVVEPDRRSTSLQILLYSLA